MDGGAKAPDALHGMHNSPQAQLLDHRGETHVAVDPPVRFVVLRRRGVAMASKVAEKLGHTARVKPVNEPYTSPLTFEELRSRMREFARERDWDQVLHQLLVF